MNDYIVTIRPYGPGEYQGVVAVLKEAGIFDEDMDAEMRYQGKIEKSPGSILIALSGAQVIGCIVVVEEWGPLLFRLAIVKEFRHKGLGGQLLEQAEEYLRKKYHKEAHLLVEENDRDLQKYYEKRGYKQGGIYRWMAKRL